MKSAGNTTCSVDECIRCGDTTDGPMLCVACGVELGRYQTMRESLTREPVVEVPITLRELAWAERLAERRSEQPATVAAVEEHLLDILSVQFAFTVDGESIEDVRGGKR